MFFDIGQRVICIGGGPSRFSVEYWESWRQQWGLTFPCRGRPYSVRKTRIAKDGTQRIRLVEIVNPEVQFSDAPNQEPWWQSVSFRPVVKRETDISVFRKILMPTVERVS